MYSIELIPLCWMLKNNFVLAMGSLPMNTRVKMDRQSMMADTSYSHQRRGISGAPSTISKRGKHASGRGPLVPVCRPDVFLDGGMGEFKTRIEVPSNIFREPKKIENFDGSSVAGRWGLSSRRGEGPSRASRIK